MQNIHIIGNGAMACLWASYFDNSQQLNFILRNKKSDIFCFIKEPEHTRIQGQAFDLNDLTSPIDHLIIATKAFDAKNALDSLHPFLHGQTQILLIQNGMGSQQDIAAHYSHLPIYACSSTEGVHKPSMQTLIHAGVGSNSIGPLTTHANFQMLNKWLPEKHFDWFDNIDEVLWKKLIINAAINPLTVLYNCQNGALVKHDKQRRHMMRLCHELDALIEKLPFNIPSAFSLAQDICLRTEHNYSSMYQDIKKQNKTEINFITGYIVKTCHTHNIDCPENIKLLNYIQGLPEK